MRVATVLVPAEITGLASANLSEETCVVFDVLRATSSMVTALHSGASAIYPVRSIEEALALKDSLPDAVLGGERRSDRIPGFEIGNSPAEYTTFAGRTIISTTTNGTVALAACASAGILLAGSFLNMRATAAAVLASRPRQVRLVCAGTFDGFAFEDGLAAGCLASLLAAESPDYADDDATAAMRILHDARADDLESACRAVGNGRALVAAGREADLAWALRPDARPVVARAEADPAGRLRIRACPDFPLEK